MARKLSFSVESILSRGTTTSTSLEGLQPSHNIEIPLCNERRRHSFAGCISSSNKEEDKIVHATLPMSPCSPFSITSTPSPPTELGKAILMSN